MTNFIKNYLYKIGKEASEKRLENILKLIIPQKNANYLDCGPFDGVQTTQIAEKIRTKKISGVERDDKCIRICKKKGIKTRKGDLNEKILFPDSSFDVVTAIEVIEHLHNTDNFMSELYRVCKKGGYVIIGTENLAAWHNIFALLLGFQPSTGPHISSHYAVGFHPLYQKHIEDTNNKIWNNDKHINVMTRDALMKLVVKYGFSIIEERPSGYYPFGGKLSDMFASFDKRHALTILLKLKKTI